MAWSRQLISGFANETPTATASDLLIDWITARSGGEDELTTRRCVGDIVFVCNTSSGVGFGPVLVFWGLLASETIPSLNLNAAPPAGEQVRQRDWLALGASGPLTTLTQPGPGVTWSLHFDIKTGRKLESNQERLYLMVQVMDSALDATVSYRGLVNTLIALP